MTEFRKDEPISGTLIFDGNMAMKGYALNKMCFSFNSAENRDAFKANEDAYCDQYEITDAQRAAVKSRDVLELLKLGGNIYYLAKLTGMFGLNMQDIGAQQSGVSLDEFKAKLLAAGEK
ncbi:protocatechuate 4,5-dioxygenase subunit alpha [Sneathiella marina]|uniref:Protocatechuate 4,5-dioxygenase subunit alpha n=1 Tax=Sneathiella marina TaxID=2950108 RepID=A0ABY4W5N5_9PROT|nr:protocatechuate 4,5-dioxygenase subunit alpha [Sneathiella marina]USG62229.1 protocatechuate 4,5-dioxygenase subunit alpha [Sneathiella marina]